MTARAHGESGTGPAGGAGMCHACGVPAYGGEMFCVACGAYLGWEETGGRPAVRQPPERPGPASPPGAAPATAPGPVPGSVRVPKTQSGSAPKARSGPAPEPYAGHGQPSPEARTVPARDETLQLSRAVVPLPYGTGHGPGPGTGPGPGRGNGEGSGTGQADAHGTGEHPQGYDHFPRLLLCPDCRSDNPDTRTYCGLCGALLRPVPEPPPLTRWQELRTRWSGRPRLWHWDRRWLAVPLALPLCFAVGTSGGWLASTAREAVPAVQDRFSGQAAVAPVSVEASTEEHGFGAGMAANGVSNRFWAPARKGAEAVGETWTATFGQPFRLTALVIFNGAATDPKAYLAAGRPTRLTAIAETVGQDGRKTVQKEIDLADQPGAQDFRWGVDDVVSLTLRIAAVHAGAQPDSPVALAEVQFFTRRAR